MLAFRDGARNLPVGGLVGAPTEGTELAIFDAETGTKLADVRRATAPEGETVEEVCAVASDDDFRSAFSRGFSRGVRRGRARRCEDPPPAVGVVRARGPGVMARSVSTGRAGFAVGGRSLIAVVFRALVIIVPAHARGLSQCPDDLDDRALSRGGMRAMNARVSSRLTPRRAPASGTTATRRRARRRCPRMVGSTRATSAA